jgi:CheY-like chemotaxis protein
MHGPILLVCDDVSLVAMLRTLLEREGVESVLATSVADALIAYSHYAPELVILDPSVEGSRGRVVLEELSKHPASGRARVVLLGREVEGCNAPVVPLPLDGSVLLQLIAKVDAGEATALSGAAEASSSTPAPSWWHPMSASANEAPAAPAVRRLPLPAASQGQITPEQLAELMMKVCNSKASISLEVKSPEATRTLWLRDGRLIGATSSLYEESLLGRARADGLLDREQEKELRQLDAGSPSELVRAMRARGYVRDVEVVPLVQRNAEQIALEALSQEDCEYRLGAEGLENRAIAAASPTPALQLLPRALERSMSEESILKSFGGLDAVPIPRQHVSGLRSLGLEEAELGLLAAVDGVATVGELLLACALPQEQALKTLMLGRVLRAIEIRPGTGSTATPGPDVDVRRLKSKFDEIQEADYFAVLGLSRTAGSEEVQLAFQVLSAEFNPLKFAGHPDPSLQSQAQEIRDLLAEAAQTLRDDRLRAAYAGNLVD